MFIFAKQMKVFFALSAVLFFSLAISVQTPTATPPAGVGKIGIVNPLLFTDEKAGAGIGRLKTAVKAAEDANKVLADKIQSDTTKYRTVVAEVERIRSAPNPNQQALSAKVIEGQDLETSLNRNREDYKRNFEKSYQQLVTPIFNQILLALNDYAKQKGYAVILNGPKLEQDDLLMGFDDRYDVTADFITFFNARPAPR
jgi:Skp family chaperone for outer membrane proteins